MKSVKRIFALMICLILIFSLGFSVSARQVRSVDSFTHNDTGSGNQVTVAMPDVFEVETVVDARSLGIKSSLGSIIDIDINETGDCFVLNEDGEIFEFDKNNKFVSNHIILDKSGKPVDFAGARGITAKKNELFIADTLNGRVLLSKNDKVAKEIKLPSSELIPSDFVFSPSKVERDSKNYLYVISEGSYYGAVMYDPEYNFVGFYGANSVKASVSTTLAYIWDTLTSNDVKRAKKIKNLPFQFVDFCIDKNDFLYTCTGLTAKGSSGGQIRMLSPGGTNILYRRAYNGVRSSSSSFGFGETEYAKRLNQKISQDFESIQVDDYGFIYALDVKYGLIYVYDTDCNLLTAFGGGRANATQNGLFNVATSLAVYDEKVYVSDSQNCSVTVFKLTKFGKTLLQAQNKTLKSKYKESEKLWQSVLETDADNQLAYRGMAKVAYKNGDYKATLKYAKKGLDYSVYGQALKMVTAEYFNNNFTWLFIVSIALIALIVFAVIYLKKKKISLVKRNEMKTMLSCYFHPFDAFNKVRYENQGSVRIAVVLTVLFFVTGVINTIHCNFRYTNFDNSTYSSLFQLVKSIGLVLTWSLANWGISVLLQGIGKFKHVFIVTAYATLPIIIYNIVSIPISYLITSPASALISGLNLVATVWAGIVICVGCMVVHGFSFPRFLVSVAVGLFFMFLILFVIFVFGILITQLWSFLVTFFMEIIYR